MSNADNNGNTGVNDRQMEMLVDYMCDHKEFAAAKLLGKRVTTNVSAHWTELSSLLNNAGPPKTETQWQKVWTSLRYEVCCKGAEIRRSCLQTGNVSKCLELTSLEEKVFHLMGKNSSTGYGEIENIPPTDVDIIAAMDGTPSLNVDTHCVTPDIVCSPEITTETPQLVTVTPQVVNDITGPRQRRRLRASEPISKTRLRKYETETRDIFANLMQQRNDIIKVQMEAALIRAKNEKTRLELEKNNLLSKKVNRSLHGSYLEYTQKNKILN